MKVAVGKNCGGFANSLAFANGRWLGVHQVGEFVGVVKYRIETASVLIPKITERDAQKII